MENKAYTENSQPRYKSWALWVSVLGLIGLILSSTGLLEKMNLNSESWDSIITALGTVLTAFGIVNNPTNKLNF